MDPRLLRYYNQELLHLREMGAEFAAQFPKIAARLRLEGLEVADPYVERLLEGFAFLAARIQLKLDAEFPRFSERMLEIVYPHFLAPVPSMLVARLDPLAGDPALAAGFTVPRGSLLRNARGGGTPVRFRTGHDCTLWPIEIAGVEYFSHAANLPLAATPAWRKYGGGVRIRLRTSGGARFEQLACEDLRLHCGGVDEIAWRLHESICGHALGVLVVSGRAHEALDADAVEPVGFDDAHALLPVGLRGFEGYRLMQEYFAFPARFLFFDLKGVGAALRRMGGSEAEVVILLDRGDAGLLQTVDERSLALHCVPAINLFEHRCDRIALDAGRVDHHLVPDRAQPMDYEVFEVLEVTGYGSGLDDERRFLPLYAAFHGEPHGHDAYYAVQREPRLLSATQRREGPRSAYIGSEVFVSITDRQEAPYPQSLQQLGVRALCSNRDLPLLLAAGTDGIELALEAGAPLAGARVVKGPSRPLSAQREGNVAWRFLNQLSLNHLSLLDTDPGEGAAALREMLRLYAPAGDAALHKQVDGLRSAKLRPVVRRLPLPGPIAFGRGVQIDIEVDDLAFQGGSAFLLGLVLERYFARHVSLNGFTQTRMHSSARGQILDGRPRCGARPVI